MAMFDDTWVPSVMQKKISDAKWTKPEKTERIANCLRLAAKRGGEFWTILEKAVKQIVADYHLPQKAENYLIGQIQEKRGIVVNLMAPFMLMGQEDVTGITELVQKGLIYDLILQIEGIDSQDVLEPLIRSMSNAQCSASVVESLIVEEAANEPTVSDGEITEIDTVDEVESREVETDHVTRSSANKVPISSLEESIDYDSHLRDRDAVRKLIDDSTKRNQEKVSLLTAVVSPMAAAAPKQRIPSTPAPRPFNFDDTDDFAQSPSGFAPSNVTNESADSPNASLLNKTDKSENPAPPPEFPELNESTSDNCEVETDEETDENIFHWGGVTMEKQTVFKDSHPLRCCRFNPADGTYIVGSNTKALRRFQCPTDNETDPKILDELVDLHDASIYCCDVGPRGNFIATGSNDKIIKILNIDKNGIKVVSEMTNHDGTIRAVKFLPGADCPTVLASGGAGDGRIYLTDVTTETVIKYAQRTERTVVTDIAAVSRDVLYAASGSNVLQWDMRDRVPSVIDIPLPVQSLSANDTVANFLSTGCENGSVAFWDMRNTTLPLYQQRGHSKAIRSISMKGNWLLAGSMDESISLHNLQKNQNLVDMECGDRVISVDLDPQIQAAITNQADGTCIYWNISFQ